jgi:peptide-methionine (S)-S-oxide reductase
MLGIFRNKSTMVDREQALAGRSQQMPVAPRHAVLGTPMKPPFPDGYQTAILGLGCFWGAEKAFWNLPGVYTTAVGYAGGYTENPTYEEVCSGRTGHTEAVLVVFDPAKISYAEILRTFWEGHDPTQGMRQGNDVGSQYRSAIYTTTPEQAEIVQASKVAYEDQLKASGYGEITTEIAPAGEFYYAEDYHQQYLHKKELAGEVGYCGLGGTGIACPIGLNVTKSTADARNLGSSQ